MRSNGRHLALVSALTLGISVLAYFLLVAIYRLPAQASAEARPIDQIMQAHFVMIAFLWSLIMVFMVYSVVAFRRRPGDDEDGAHFHGNTALEVGWTFIPTVVVLAFGFWGAIVLDDITSAKDNEMVVQVLGEQWQWRITYPEQDGLTTVDLMVLPVNHTIRLEMEAKEVLHSFWVPEFRVKQDLVPGQPTILRVTPTEPGEYTLRCAEMCGFDHAEMLATVRVVSEADFAAWVEETAAGAIDLTAASPEERGELWATEFACAGCHTTDGATGAGPTWQGLFGREEQMTDGSTITVDEAYLTESILDPNAHIVAGFNPVMPPDFGERFDQREHQILEEQGVDIDILADLIDYIQTLEE
jgi:cytochrome c oxidase subunit II